MSERQPNLLVWIRASEIQSLVPYSLNHILRLENAGEFPKRVRIGANRVAWLQSEVDEWLKNKLAARNDSSKCSGLK
ncbi:AlpA family phage regulatory protein [Paracoccaceae bacterium]|jgi:predicted DNA-binding transcriptional regulator AlpA|nr:AlpA family phage regulatory protein [Paracoccaceae bacterium]